MILKCPNCGKDISIRVDKHERKSQVNKVSFNFETRKFEGISQADVDGFAEAYPGVDIIGEMRKMREWALANPQKMKGKNVRRFMVIWFGKAMPEVKPQIKKDPLPPIFWVCSFCNKKNPLSVTVCDCLNHKNKNSGKYKTIGSMITGILGGKVIT